MEMEKSSNGLKIRPLKDVESQGRIIGELRLFVPHVSLTLRFSPHSNRHRMNLSHTSRTCFKHCRTENGDLIYSLYIDLRPLYALFFFWVWKNHD